MTPPSPIQNLLTQWREAAEKATKGLKVHWDYYGGYDCMWSAHRLIGQNDVEVAQMHSFARDHERDPQQEANAQLFALSRTALPTAIEMLEVAVGTLEALARPYTGADGNHQADINRATSALSTLQTLAERKEK